MGIVKIHMKLVLKVIFFQASYLDDICFAQRTRATLCNMAEFPLWNVTVFSDLQASVHINTYLFCCCLIRKPPSRLLQEGVAHKSRKIRTWAIPTDARCTVQIFYQRARARFLDYSHTSVVTCWGCRHWLRCGLTSSQFGTCLHYSHGSTTQYNSRQRAPHTWTSSKPWSDAITATRWNRDLFRCSIW